MITEKDVYGQEPSFGPHAEVKQPKPHYRIIWPSTLPLYFHEARENGLISVADKENNEIWLYPTVRKEYGSAKR